MLYNNFPYQTFTAAYTSKLNISYLYRLISSVYWKRLLLNTAYNA